MCSAESSDSDAIVFGKKSSSLRNKHDVSLAAISVFDCLHSPVAKFPSCVLFCEIAAALCVETCGHSSTLGTMRDYFSRPPPLNVSFSISSLFPSVSVSLSMSGSGPAPQLA